MSAARNRTIALSVLLVVLATGCARDSEPSTPAATLAPAPSETATSESPSEAGATEPADEFAIPADPDDIDKQYVERVLLALDRGVVEATRQLVRDRRLSPAVKALLEPTHLPEARRGYYSAFREALRAPGPLPFRADPEIVEIISVDEIKTATQRCIFTAVTQDSSGLVREPLEPFQVYYHLVAKQEPSDAEANPTPWMVAADSEPPRGGKEFRDPCSEG